MKFNVNKKYIFIIILFLAVSFLAYCFYPVVNYKTKNSPSRILIYDRAWEKITDMPNKFGYKIKLTKKEFEKIKNSLFVKSLIKIEDKNFYSNFWIDLLAKLRALKDNLEWKQISGASTITEQLIKNKYFLGYKRTYIQKAREAILALYFNVTYSKDEILLDYLNTVFMWNNLYWVKTASKVYFDKNIKNLTKQEISILLSLIHYPSVKYLQEKSFKKYQNKIKKRLWFSTDGFNHLKSNNSYFNHLNKFKLLNKFPFVTQRFFIDNNLKIDKKTSTIDSKLQNFSKKIVNKVLQELKNKNVTNAWVIVLYNNLKDKKWQILVYLGSKNFFSKEIDGQVDVLQARRQLWSSVKPFLYLMALEKQAWTESLLVDIESEYNSFKNWKSYISENYSLKEYGLIRLKEALWNSLNNATVRLARELGLWNVYDFYKKYGFKLENSPDYYWYSLVLGNPSIKLYDLVNSYKKLVPDWISKEKFLLYKILASPDNRQISFWINSILNTSIPMAVKTWTSSDFRDNVVVSYHPNLIVWVWVWNNDNSSMKWVTGITWAWYIWHQIIEKAISLWYVQDIDLKVPKGIVQKFYCLTKDCFRKEIIWARKNKKYYSKIKDNYYSKKDLFEELSDYEIKRLKDLWFEIK